MQPHFKPTTYGELYQNSSSLTGFGKCLVTPQMSYIFCQPFLVLVYTMPFATKSSAWYTEVCKTFIFPLVHFRSIIYPHLMFSFCYLYLFLNSYWHFMFLGVIGFHFCSLVMDGPAACPPPCDFRLHD